VQIIHAISILYREQEHIAGILEVVLIHQLVLGVVVVGEIVSQAISNIGAVLLLLPDAWGVILIRLVKAVHIPLPVTILAPMVPASLGIRDIGVVVPLTLLALEEQIVLDMSMTVPISRLLLLVPILVAAGERVSQVMYNIDHAG